MIKVRNLDPIKPAPQPAEKQQLENRLNGFIQFNNELKQPAPAPEPQQQPEPERDTVHEQAELAAKLGAAVCITGMWAWAEFNRMPSAEIRNTLKANNWTWCKNKGKWAFKGKPSSSRKNMTWDYIIGKYGEEKINERGALSNV